MLKATDYRIVKQLYTGRAIDSERKVVDGNEIGSATIKSFDAGAMTLFINNEYSIAKIGEKVVATVPGLVCIVGQETSRRLNAKRF